MATYMIEAHHRGAYELPVPAGAVVTVQVAEYLGAGMDLIVIQADSPVYVKQGTTVSPRDPESKMILEGTADDVPIVAYATTVLAITCATDAIVSLVRA